MNPESLTIEVVGIGLDGAEGLRDRVRQLLEKATVLVGSNRHLSYFPCHPARKIILGDFSAAIATVQQAWQAKERIVILATGDPLFFGLGRLLLQNFPAEKLRFHPHISSLQLAFSRLKLPWQDAQLVSVHGRSLEGLTPFLQQGRDKIAILTDSNNNPSAIARFYLSLDLPIQYDLWIGENLGSENEKISYFSAEEIKIIASLPAGEFSPLNLVILLRQSLENSLNLQQLPLLGLPDSTFLSFPDRPGLMTKREIRLAVLGELALQPAQIVWDVGAGTGSVAIEIARLCPTSTIYAIEKTEMGKTLIEKNCQRLQVTNVIPIQGQAPEILSQLPAPNRIFIGGSGGNLPEILATCADKLQQAGVLVLALATLEHLRDVISWLGGGNWDYRLLQLQISRSVPVGQFTRFSPLNPVTIVTAKQNS
jgi:precorrin-6Y C5,15-methyltransferase (decarboxylating)